MGYIKAYSNMLIILYKVPVKVGPKHVLHKEMLAKKNGQKKGRSMTTAYWRIASVTKLIFMWCRGWLPNDSVLLEKGLMGGLSGIWKNYRHPW